MSIAALVHTLLAAGVDHETVVAAVRAVEQREDDLKRSSAAERQARYRARLGLTVSEWQMLRTRVCERDGFECQYCGDTEGPFHIDHIVPLSKGGSNEIENLTVACRACNCGKSGKTIEQWSATR